MDAAGEAAAVAIATGVDAEGADAAFALLNVVEELVNTISQVRTLVANLASEVGAGPSSPAVVISLTAIASASVVLSVDDADLPLRRRCGLRLRLRPLHERGWNPRSSGV